MIRQRQGMTKPIPLLTQEFGQDEHLYSMTAPSCFLIYGLARHLSSTAGNNAHLKLMMC